MSVRCPYDVRTMSVMSVRCPYDVRTTSVRCPVVCPWYVRGMSRASGHTERPPLVVTAREGMVVTARGGLVAEVGVAQVG